MKFNDIVKEDKIPILGTTKMGKMFRMYRGLHLLVLNENEPPDVHGIPKEMEAYGRGWVQDGRIYIDGGPQGSRQGHPPTAKEGFYWAIDYDKYFVDSEGKKRQGIVYVRGRAGTSEDFLEKNIFDIMKKIYKRT